MFVFPHNRNQLPCTRRGRANANDVANQLCPYLSVVGNAFRLLLVIRITAVCTRRHRQTQCWRCTWAPAMWSAGRGLWNHYVVFSTSTQHSRPATKSMASWRLHSGTWSVDLGNRCVCNYIFLLFPTLMWMSL